MTQTTHENAEHEVQKAFSPGKVFGQSYIWDSVLRPLCRELSVLCMLEKLIREAALKYPDDLSGFSREVDRMMMALSQLEEDGIFRKLEMRAHKGFWSQEKFNRTLARLVKHCATKLKLPETTTAPNLVTIPYGLSQPQLRETLRLSDMFSQALAGSSPNIEPKDFQVIVSNLNTPRPGPTPTPFEEAFRKDVRSMAQTAREQGFPIPPPREIAIALRGPNFDEIAVELYAGEYDHETKKSIKRTAVCRKISEILRSK